MVLLPALQCQHLLGCRPLLLLGHIQLILGLLQLTARLLRPAVGIRQLPTQLLQLTCSAAAARWHGTVHRRCG